MTDIRISRITLDNFKCFRNKEITFSDDITVIKGRNGVGKTTIADAILWCLFGKNTQGQSDFSVKTMEDGSVIPHLDHSVELELTTATDGAPRTITIRRTLKETWIKKRGSNEQVFKNNTTEYMFNGEAMTATDFKKAVNELIPEDIFRIVTNPLYFPSLKWQEQRNFLSTLADGEPDFSDDKDLLALHARLIQANEDIIAYKKHLSYRIKEIKEKLKQIPVRLAEQNKALPERLDWDALDAQYASILERQAEVSNQILAIKSGSGGVIERERIRTEIRKVQDDIDRIEERANKTVRETRADLDSKITMKRASFAEITRNKADLDAKVFSYDALVRRCNETLEKCEEEACEIRSAWADNQKKFDASGIETTCPTCGQILPDEQINEMVEKMRENYNIRQAKVKAELRDKASAVKQRKADAEKELENLKAQKEADLELGLRMKDEINAKHKEIVDLERTPLLTIDDILTENKDYSALIRKKESLMAQLSNAGEGDNEQLKEMERSYDELKRQGEAVAQQALTRVQYKRIEGFIEDIRKEENDLVASLSELEQQEDIARSYQERQNDFLETSINRHFALVRWSLFRTVNNGGDPFIEPYCECYVNGVAYHDGLNQAARLNAGLDIIRTLCKHYEVTAPIVVDNSESNLNILKTESQQIRLEVFNSELEVL